MLNKLKKTKFFEFIRIIKSNLYSKNSLKRYYHRKVYQLKLKDISLEYSTEDDYSKRWFYPRYSKGQIHEPGMTNFLLKHLEPDHNFFDVGANIGFFTCLAAKKSPNGKVVAFEVDPNCIQLLKKNLEKNGLLNATVENKAVSEKDGKVYIPNINYPNPGLSISEIKTEENSFPINTISLDNFTNETKVYPDLIKIDVEGAELLVLKGMEQLLDSKKPNMLIEVHPEKLKKFFSSSANDVLEVLWDKGFFIYQVEDHRVDDGAIIELRPGDSITSNDLIFASNSEISDY